MEIQNCNDWMDGEQHTHMLAETKGKLEPQNWRSTRSLYTWVSLCLNRFSLSSRQGWLPQFTYVVHITSSTAYPATTFRFLSKRGNERSPHVFSAPFPDNPQLAVCHILSDVSVICIPLREVSSQRAGFSVPTSVPSASIRPDA